MLLLCKEQRKMQQSCLKLHRSLSINLLIEINNLQPKILAKNWAERRGRAQQAVPPVRIQELSSGKQHVETDGNVLTCQCCHPPGGKKLCCLEHAVGKRQGKVQKQNETNNIKPGLEDEMKGDFSTERGVDFLADKKVRFFFSHNKYHNRHAFS